MKRWHDIKDKKEEEEKEEKEEEKKNKNKMVSIPWVVVVLWFNRSEWANEPAARHISLLLLSREKMIEKTEQNSSDDDDDWLTELS